MGTRHKGRGESWDAASWTARSGPGAKQRMGDMTREAVRMQSQRKMAEYSVRSESHAELWSWESPRSSANQIPCMEVKRSEGKVDQLV